MLVIGRPPATRARRPAGTTVSGPQAMLRRGRTAPYHVGYRVLSSPGRLQEALRGALRGHGAPPCGRRGVRGAGGATPALAAGYAATRRMPRAQAATAALSLSLCGTWLRRSSSPRAREPGVHPHLLDICLCGLRLHVEDVPRLRLHHTAPYHRLLRRSTHLATVCAQQAAPRLGAGGS